MWNKLKYFSKNEKWGDYKIINGFIILLLEQIRHDFENKKISSQLIIHSAYRSNSSKDNKHSTASAVDFHFHNLDFKVAYTELIKTLNYLQVHNFIGLGVYPQWRNPGFHLDIRDKKGRWGQWNNKYCTIDYAISKLD